MAAVVCALPLLSFAQDGTAEVPLGDVARNLRKKPPAEEVIDNDNIGKALEQAQSRRAANAVAQYSIDGGGKTFEISTPDANCRLSFSANSKALLSNQYTQMTLPPEELAKLEGPAILDGSSLQVAVFNGTDWHVSEVAVAVTQIRHEDPKDMAKSKHRGPLVPAAQIEQNIDAPPAEKQPDITTLYRIRAAAAPAVVTVFRAPLQTEIPSGQEWHWAIVEAKGYPPPGTPAKSMAAH